MSQYLYRRIYRCSSTPTLAIFEMYLRTDRKRSECDLVLAV